MLSFCSGLTEKNNWCLNQNGLVETYQLICTSNHMALRVIWDKYPELFYKIVKSPERSEGDLIL